jgi:phosphoribosyl 1,2-cyclic phosphodiesterase
MSRTGHLSNAALNEFLASDDFDREARIIVLAHLSEQNNHPEIARLAASSSLQSHNAIETRLTVSSQKVPTEVFCF